MPTKPGHNRRLHPSCLALAVLLGTAMGSGPLSLLNLPAARAQLAALVPDQKVIPVEEFFEVLRDYGTWLDSDRYGHVFCPHPDVVGVDFQPYMRGHWTMSEFGWTFVSSSKISWVTDHYGRWVEVGLPNCSWAWLPGRDWSPAWVEFRVSDRVIAWRPQPYSGPPVRMALPPAVQLPRVTLPPEIFSRDGRDAGFVVVNDNDFTARRIEGVALSGSQLYAALRETEPLQNPRAGLHSSERQQIAARIVARREALAQGVGSGGTGGSGSTGSGSSKPGLGSGGTGGAQDASAAAPPEPARRRKPGTAAALPGTAGLGTATTLRAGAQAADAGKEGDGKRTLTGAQPGQTPPTRSTLPAGLTPGQPGEFSGTKVFEWGGPDKNKKPAAKPGTPKPEPARRE
ncbi:MAG: hypothetical protein JNJ46_05805 [Myxococcales bacterium]|nr:hypothetical protein [Myxococcales bacterium]